MKTQLKIYKTDLAVHMSHLRTTRVKVAQWLERLTGVLQVAESIPTGVLKFRNFLSFPKSLSCKGKLHTDVLFFNLPIPYLLEQTPRLY